MDYFDNWIVQMRKGLLEYFILRALLARERYGYDLVKGLAAQGGAEVTEGTLYPLLSRLRTQGLVATRLEESSAGPARKYYALTPKGRRLVAQMAEHLAAVLRQSQEEGEGVP